MSNRKEQSGSGPRPENSQRRRSSRNRNRPPRNRDENRNPERGGERESAPNNGQRNGGGAPSAGSILPSPTILQEYEYATEGAAHRILEMAEVEQDRRNSWENDYLAFYKKSLRIGQLFGFLLMSLVVGAYMYLAGQGLENEAIILAGIAFFSVALSNLFAGVAKRKNARRKWQKR